MEWIECSTRLPIDEEGDYFLIWGEDEDGDREIYKAYLGHDTCWYWRDMEFSNVTHWMPLPEPPKK
jgi:hypothetical protein